MAREITELEGTWEEIMGHAEELAGKRVRLVVLPVEENSASQDPEFSTARSLLKYAGTWVGDDLPELLRDVYENRSQAKF
jgi:hypothetical protein